MIDKRLKDLVRNATRAEQEERRAMARPALAVGINVIDLCQEAMCMEEAKFDVTVHGDRMDSDRLKLCGAHREVIERKAKRAGMTVTITPHVNGVAR